MLPGQTKRSLLAPAEPGEPQVQTPTFASTAAAATRAANVIQRQERETTLGSAYQKWRRPAAGDRGWRPSACAHVAGLSLGVEGRQELGGRRVVSRLPRPPRGLGSPRPIKQSGLGEAQRSARSRLEIVAQDSEHVRCVPS